MPDPYPPAPAPASIDVGDGLAESESPVKMFQRVTVKLTRRADGTMMRVMEQQLVAFAAAEPVPADALQKLDRVPLVHDRDVRAIERPVEVESFQRVAHRTKQGIVTREACNGSFSLRLQ